MGNLDIFKKIAMRFGGRDYSDKELNNESHEFFRNKETKDRMPNLFKNRKDFFEKYKTGKIKSLDKIDVSQLHNSDVPAMMSRKNPERYAKHVSNKYGKNFDSIKQSFNSGGKLPPPIMIRDKSKKLYLMSGNTRLMGAKAFNKNLPVKMIDYHDDFKMNN